MPGAPDQAADDLYLKLKGARERLCVAQMSPECDELDRRLLGEAITNIDNVGARLPQWSRFDYPDDSEAADV